MLQLININSYLNGLLSYCSEVYRSGIQHSRDGGQIDAVLDMLIVKFLKGNAQTNLFGKRYFINKINL